MKKLKPFLMKLENKLADLEKPATSHREHVLAEVIVVFAVVAWMAAMTLLP